ncbi:hypothetical protein Hanom_Chr09g00861011 [Helianthus anomalus]
MHRFYQIGQSFVMVDDSASLKWFLTEISPTDFAGGYRLAVHRQMTIYILDRIQNRFPLSKLSNRFRSSWVLIGSQFVHQESRGFDRLLFYASTKNVTSINQIRLSFTPYQHETPRISTIFEVVYASKMEDGNDLEKVTRSPSFRENEFCMLIQLIR